MKLKMKKLVSLGLVSAMSLTMLAGCGNSNGATNDTGSSKNQESKAAGDVKIGVLVQDVSGEEALGFRAYYEDYVADQYGVTFAGKYSSSVGPAFALVMNAVNGNVIRDAEGNAVSISQNYQVATDEATFDEFFKTDNGDNPIYNKETLDTIIGDSVTCDDITKLVESK